MDKQRQSFIVLSHPRSGTTHFCNHILANHPEIFAFDELFNQKNHEPTKLALKKNGIGDFYGLTSKIEGRVFGPVARFKRYHQRFEEAIYKNHHKQIIGFKLFGNQMPNLALKSFLIDPNIKIILLRRRNLAKAAVSWYLLNNHNQRNYRDKTELSSYTIDIDWCAYWIANTRYQMNQYEAIMKEAGKKYYYAEYESLFNLEAINSIYNYLGASTLNVLPEGMTSLSGSSTYKKMSNLKEFEDKICNDYNGYLLE